MKVIHSLKPIYDENSVVLILGSIPSVKSRQLNFYYANPRNRFWETLSKVYNEEIEDTIISKTTTILLYLMLLKAVILTHPKIVQ